MKIIATVLETGTIAKPSENDQKKGLRYFTVFQEEIEKKLGSKTYKEVLLYSVKSTDALEVFEGNLCLLNGKLWEMKNDEQVTIRGFTNPEITKLAD